MRRCVAAAGVVSFVAVAALVPSASAHHLPREGDVRFKVRCDYSHSLNDDPIVFLGMPGVSHRHDFFGNEQTNAFTVTYEQLQAGTTNCNHPGDKAAYWTPSVYAGGLLQTPSSMTTYYRLGEKIPPIEAYPPGLKVIAGFDGNGPSGNNAEWHGWKCTIKTESSTGDGLGDPPPASCPENRLMAQIRFPDCWDGVNTDSPDHRSHMAYSYNGANDHDFCPATHPVQVPELTVDINYVTSRRPITLASGDVSTLHADFFNGWDAAALQERVDTCLNGLRRCDAGAP